MKRAQQRNHCNRLVYALRPVYCCGLTEENVMNLTGMVWSGGISAAAIPRFQTYR